ncbi:MAG: ABC transporter ATP-binding protein [Candidatus Firestonebacteria bacterium]
MAYQNNVVIELKDIRKIYKTGDIEFEALKCIDLIIKEGDFLAIMGPSGSGKSTCMNIIGCLDKATSGSYKLENIEISNLLDNELSKVRNKKIGFIFQNFNLLPRVTALHNVELPLIYAGEKNRKEKALKCLELVGLSDKINNKPNELSGGQQQRVAIARALVNEPAIILADEPTGNLDTHSSEEIMKILIDLHTQGKTIILITHEFDIAKCAQKTIHFRDGNII